MITRKTSYLSSKSSPTISRPSTPIIIEEWDADDESSPADNMSLEDSTPSRPLSVSIPRAGSRSRRPNLKEILTNSAPPPWTLTAFMAYLSQNHCLETLEFTMDAGRYSKHYNKMISKAEGKKALSAKDADNIKVLWQRLIEAYIKPNGSREVNLPSEVRDPILSLDYSTSPPAPETLDPAVAKIYELMEESVLVPFLNSVSPHTTQSAFPSYGESTQDRAPTTAQTYSEQPHSHFGRRRSKENGNSPPSSSTMDSHAPTYSSSSSFSRKTAPSTLSTALNRHRFSTKISPTSSHSNSSPAPLHATLSRTSAVSEPPSFPGLTDDSASTSSPGNDGPMTPPMSPPVSESVGSPRMSRDSGAWKKLGRLSQWKPGRKRSQNNLKDDES